MAQSDNQISWHFDFGLERADGSPMSDREAETFFDLIVALAEARNLQIGGGFAPYPAETSGDVLFPLR